VITDFAGESAAQNVVVLDPPSGRSSSASACEPWREVIESGISHGRNARAIWRDLVDDHGFTGGYQSVRRFVGKVRGSSSPEARVVIITAPGEEAQVDYGSDPMVRDPKFVSMSLLFRPDIPAYEHTSLAGLPAGFRRDICLDHQ
jgi:hypothetical protein